MMVHLDWWALFVCSVEVILLTESEMKVDFACWVEVILLTESELKVEQVIRRLVFQALIKERMISSPVNLLTDSLFNE